MTSATQLHSGDSVLLPFLEAESDDAASAALAPLLAGDVERVILDTVRRELARSMAGAGHMEDVASEVRVRIVRKLWSLRRTQGEPIDNLLAYVSTTAEYGCHGFLRLQYPERTRFRNRLRYAVSHQPSTTLVRDELGGWRCETRQGPRRAPEPGSTQAFIDQPRAWLERQKINPTQPLPALAAQILAALDRGIELDRLVDALATVLGIVDAQPSRHRENADAFEGPQLADPAPGAADVLEHRDALLRTWTEIVALPARQRAALLLNLRDPDGGAILHMLPSTGVVTSAAIAAALEIGQGELDGLWERLPLDDLSIASQLGLTRQQVINLRKSARARLARRLHGNRA